MSNNEPLPLILAVETSSRIGSVAIAYGEKMIAKNCFSGPMKHSSEIFPVIQSLIKSIDKKPENIEHLYISGGPGSFTGLRIAVSIAKMMHLANNVKIVKVDTLDVIATNVRDYFEQKEIKERDNARTGGLANETIAVILDAKRGQFFIAVYEIIREKKETLIKKVHSDSLMSIMKFHERFVCSGKTIKLLGDGLLYNKERFESDGITFFEDNYWSPRAENVHKLGLEKAKMDQFEDPLELKPFYLSRPDAKIKKR
ncbi:tRNA (adenosine(37)-N6)-threonylcarbamoyltransferase complex dimerization subunit type 1 TsaB [Planctomycetota bacterium]